jgi:hypothetical protein
MRATRTIERVDFEVHAPGGALIDRRTTNEIELSGVTDGEDRASISVVADATWPVSASISRGSYVLAIVRGHNGEVLVRRANMPFDAH